MPEKLHIKQYLKYILKALGKFILMEFHHNSFYKAKNVWILQIIPTNYLLQINLYFMNKFCLIRSIPLISLNNIFMFLFH